MSSEERIQSPNAAVRDARSVGYVGQRELGSLLEVSAVRAGRLLDGAGLKQGKLPTEYAVRIGASSELLTGHSPQGDYQYCLWRPEVVVPILRPLM
jgi:hypothetical protein